MQRRCDDERLPSDEVLGLVVLVTEVLLNLLALGEVEQAADLPGPRVRVGIVDGDLDRHAAHIDASIAFDDVEPFGLRTATFEPLGIADR